MKVCSICKVAKPLTEFYVTPSKPGGYYDYCRPCDRERVREYSKTPNGKLSTIARTRRKAKKFPDKMKAQQQLRNAVKTGLVIRPTVCDNCQSGGRIDGHHEDYSKPLDVMWLCDPCHKLQHGKLVDLSLIKKDPLQGSNK